MKTYPSIPRDAQEFKAHTFDKLDGSNLRFEWNKKKGWVKFGTRRRLFDESDEVFGGAIPLFHKSLGEKLHDIAKKARWESAVFFAEFWGPHSFAGCHIDSDPKHLSLIDVAPYKKGLLSPSEFRKLFEDKVLTAAYLGEYNWTKGFRQRVWNGEIEGISFEGVVGKRQDNKRLIMAKAKTRSWIEAVKLRFSLEEANKLINS